MKNGPLKIFCVAWVIFVSCTAIAQIAGIIPAEKGSTILLFTVMPVFAVIFFWLIFRGDGGDDEDSSDAFLSYAYKDMPCNIYYGEDNKSSEDGND